MPKSDALAGSVRLRYHGRVIEAPAGMALRDALVGAGLEPDSLLAVRDGVRLRPDLPLGPGGEVLLVDSILGG